jgi:prepilin-type N-terminal cleavage/methylation domain-containing protein
MCKISLQPNFHHHNEGFTIIEVLVAISLFSIAFMALTTAILAAGRTTRATDFADQSVMAGQESVEMLSVIPIDNVDLDGGTVNEIERNQATLKLEWEALDPVDSDGDGTDDYKTIALRAFSQGKLTMQTYYRRQIN